MSSFGRPFGFEGLRQKALPVVKSRPSRRSVPPLSRFGSRLFFSLNLFFLTLGLGGAISMERYVRSNVEVFYEPGLTSAAREIPELVDSTKRDLQRIFGFPLDIKVSVVLVKDPKKFERMVGTPLIVAFAVPKKGLVVLDYSKATRTPGGLQVVLKHEVCHLALHDYLRGKPIPRWLEEGICQWASDSIGEILSNIGGSPLTQAALRKTLIPLKDLHRGFAANRESLILAYEESKSFATYLTRKFGKGALLDLLARIKETEGLEEAFKQTFSASMQDLESQWRQSLARPESWLAFLSYHLYQILFSLGALLTFWAFIRLLIRRRAYRREQEGPEEESR